MIPRGLRIFIALLLLLLLSPFRVSSAKPLFFREEIPLSTPFNDRSIDWPYSLYFPIITQSEAAPEPNPLCEVIDKSPPDETVFAAGADFDMRWTLKNTSGFTWAANSALIRFISGNRLHYGEDLRDLPFDVSPNNAVDVIISMQAPTIPGTYTTNWAIANDVSAFCRFFATIKVQ